MTSAVPDALPDSARPFSHTAHLRGPLPEVPRVASIDRFRGIAILLVVLYHINGLVVFPNGWGISRDANGTAHLLSGPNLLRFLLLPIHMGRMGVNLFFVISGLCIHLRMALALARDRQAPFLPKVYFLRRFWRIYPVYWAALALGIVVAPPLYALEATLDGYSFRQILSFPTVGSIASHMVMLHSFFKPYIMDILPPLWSIATEEQFYLLYPLVFIALGRRITTPTIVLCLLLLTVTWRLCFVFSSPPPHDFSQGPFLVWLHGFSLSRYYEWALGALLAWAIAERRTLQMFSFWPWPWLSLGARKNVVRGLGLGLICLGAGSLVNVRLKWLIEDPCYSTGWFLIMASVLLPEAPRKGPPVQQQASAPPAASRWSARLDARLQGLGRRSFSVYLLHELVLLNGVWLVDHFHLPRLLVGAPLAFFATIAFCYGFYRLVEVPFERRSKAVR